MRQAITTKYLGATNTKGARVKAKAEAGSVTLGWDYALSVVENHRFAAEALAERFGWGGRLVGGGTATGYVFVDVTGQI